MTTPQQPLVKPELLPCPFCGKKPSFLKGKRAKDGQLLWPSLVKCSGCRIQMREPNDWNRRTPVQPVSDGEEVEKAWCGGCGGRMQIVRPGKYQCSYCETVNHYEKELQDLRQKVEELRKAYKWSKSRFEAVYTDKYIAESRLVLATKALEEIQDYMSQYVVEENSNIGHWKKIIKSTLSLLGDKQELCHISPDKPDSVSYESQSETLGTSQQVPMKSDEVSDIALSIASEACEKYSWNTDIIPDLADVIRSAMAKGSK